MKKNMTLLMTLMSLFFIAGCTKTKQDPLPTVKKPTTLSQLQNLLQVNSLSLEANETKSATRKTIEKTQDKKIESVTLTVKHILKANETNIQQMQETEIRVNSFEETNELLEKIGFFHRSYQEKKREKYILNEHEIDIDTWPGIPTYFEVEGKDKKDLEEILNILGYSFDDAISCTVDEIYRKIGMDINNMSELKFEDN